MSRKKVLYVCHNHPAVRPGGSEAYALELHQAMHASHQFEPIFLARTGPPVSSIRRPHEGTLFTTVNEDPSQYFMYTDPAEFDWFHVRSTNKDVSVKYFRDFLLACNPDVVHFQHTLFLGYEVLRVTRNTLPHAPIVYTLHEYLPICHRNGQMLRAQNDEPCMVASPRRCHECFTDITPEAFFMRKRYIQSHLALVDLFVAPSRFLLERYVDWGIPREKIVFEENGRHLPQPLIDDEEVRARKRIGFFGQFNFFKGVNVLLQAMKLLSEEEEDAHLWLHGANLELQDQAFQDEFQALLKSAEKNVTLVGRYDHDQLPGLMTNVDWVVVPSVWWENSPLVIQEAFQYRRPVICSDIGGMAEKVTDGVNGLHFRARDAVDLARTIRRAATTPGVWDELSRGIPQVYPMKDHVESLTEKYQELLCNAGRDVEHAAQ